MGWRLVTYVSPSCCPTPRIEGGKAARPRNPRLDPPSWDPLPLALPTPPPCPGARGLVSAPG